MREAQASRYRRRTTMALVFLWLAFLVRGLWYCALLPPWEAYDEPFHFAALQYVASGPGMPHAGTPISLEVQKSLHLLPLPWELQFHSIPQPLTTQDEFWRLPPAERERRVDALRALSPDEGSEAANEAIQNYESQQAPLYYWLFAIPLRGMGSLSLLSRVYLIRILGLILASVAIPLIYWIARQVLRSEAQALGATAIIVLLPELMINVARVGNECLALLCYTAMLAGAVRVLQRPLLWCGWLLLGAGLGSGLLTKAYFLTAVPAVVVVAAACLWSHNQADAIKRAMAPIALRLSFALAVTILIAGRWYIHVHSMTGSWSGLAEDAALRQVSLWNKLAAVVHVNWRSGILSVLISHVWFGAWSFLRLPVAVYVLAFVVIALAITGVVVRLLRRQTPPVERTEIVVLTAFYACFWAGLAYDIVILYLIHGVSATTGWYLYATVAAEIVLLIWGLEAFLSARVVLPMLALCVAGLDLYGSHALLMPYYTGLTAHVGASVPPTTWPTFTHLGLVFSNLSELHPTWLGAPMLVGCWLGYWAATVGAVLLVASYFRQQTTSA